MFTQLLQIRTPATPAFLFIGHLGYLNFRHWRTADNVSDRDRRSAGSISATTRGIKSPPGIDEAVS